MSTISTHSCVKKFQSAYALRSKKKNKQLRHSHRTHCTHRVFCPYTLRSRKGSLCSCRFCVPEESVRSNIISVEPEKKMPRHGKGVADHRQRSAPYNDRASWNTSLERDLINICYGEWVGGNYHGKGFSAAVLARITTALNDQCFHGDKVFTVDMVKNKLKNYRQNYNLHMRCLGYSGSAWDDALEKLSISDLARAEIIGMDSYKEQLITHGCPNFTKCHEMWQNSAATGEGSISSSGGMSMDSGGAGPSSTARNTTPLAFLEARAREERSGNRRRPPTATEERTARMRGYDQFQQFIQDRPRPVDRNEEIRTCIELVETMDCPDMQKMYAGMALRDDATRAVFLSWTYERRMNWISTLGP